MNQEQIIAKINQRRRQVLIHSIIYYILDDSIISDATWGRWAKELEELQNTYPEIAEQCVYADDFRGFDHSTGFNLPLHDEWANNKARQLLARRKK